MKAPLIQLTIAILALIAAAGGYVLGFGLVSSAKEEATTLASDIAAKEVVQARGASARTRLAEVVSDEEFLAGHFVASADIVSFLEGLEGAGDAFGATVKVASVTGATPTEEGRIALALSIEGSFDAVMKTLGVIEHGRYAMTARDLSLSGVDGLWILTGSFVAMTITP